MSVGDLVYNPNNGNALVYDPYDGNKLVYFVDRDEPPEDDLPPDEEEDIPTTGWYTAYEVDTWRKSGSATEYGTDEDPLPPLSPVYNAAYRQMRNSSIADISGRGTGALITNFENTSSKYRIVTLHAQVNKMTVSESGCPALFNGGGTIDRIKIRKSHNWNDFSARCYLSILGMRSAPPSSWGTITSGPSIYIPYGDWSYSPRSYTIPDTFADYSGSLALYYSMWFWNYYPNGAGDRREHPMISHFHLK